MGDKLAETIGDLVRSRAASKAALTPKELQKAVADTIRNTFGEATGALGDWSALVDPDTAAAVPAVAENVIVLVLTNIGATGHLADYLEFMHHGAKEAGSG